MSEPHENSEESEPSLHKKQKISQTLSKIPVNLLSPPQNSSKNPSLPGNQAEEPHGTQFNETPTKLTPEAENLIQRWKAGNFVEFNRWIQISKTDCKVEFSMKNGPGGVRSFACNMALSFTRAPQVSPFFSTGFGKSKKEAKFKATESILRDLIQKDCFKFGMRGNSAVKTMGNLTENGSLQVLRKNYLNKKTRNLNYEMMELLQQDKFKEACEIYSKLCMIKNIEWKDTFLIWTYALLKHNLAYISIVLDLMNLAQEEKGPKSLQILGNADNEKLKKINELLSQKYGFSRLPSRNPYEIFDNFNVYVREIDFCEDSRPTKQNVLEENLCESPDINVFAKMSIYNEDFTLSPLKETEMHSLPVPKPQDIFSNQFSSLANTGKFSSNEPKEIENKGISLKIANSLFDSLIYVGDLSFCLQGAEILYNKLSVSHENFVCKEAGEYYLNKKNILILEVLESMFQLFSRAKEKKFNIVTNISGTLTKIGEDFSELLLNFAPNMQENEIKSLISQRKNSEYRENCLQIAEGDYVILSSFYEEDKSSLGSPEEKVASLKNYLNVFSEQMRHNNLEGEAKSLISTLNENAHFFEEALIANVNEISNNYHLKLSILPSHSQIKHILSPDRVWKITKMFNKELFDKCSNALVSFVSNNCVSNTLAKIILAPQKAYQEIQIFPQLYQNIGSVLNANLNSLQGLACTFAFSQPITLVEGAPGTGKTHLAGEIIAQWVKQSPLPILACSPTTQTTAILYNKLSHMGLKTIKLGDELDEIRDMNRDILFRQFSYNFSKQQYDSLSFKMNKQMILDSQVVCCSCLAAGSDLLDNLMFTRVIIDEAHQLSEVETLIPIVKKCQQLVLLGDRKKIPPRSISFLAQTKGMSISLFERLILGGIQPINLNMQYKMHPTISVFPSYHFYNNLLENMNTHQQLAPPLKVFKSQNQIIREFLIHVKGEEEIFQDSLFNRKEIQMTINVLLTLINQDNINLNDIEIITVYVGQQMLLKKEIASLLKKRPELFKLAAKDLVNKDCNQLIDVDLFDDCTVFFFAMNIKKIINFKIKEKEIVIFSSVRCNRQGVLGYLKDSRIFNTILTRAKNGLIIIGDIETLGFENFLNKYINWAKANKIIVLEK